MIHLDTQIAVWLFANKPRQLSREATRTIERSQLFLSPFVLVELEILVECGRLDIDVDSLVRGLGADFNVRLSSASTEAIMRRARTFAWTRDPFDRLIVANAMADDARLVTADKHIQQNFKNAVW